MRRALASLVAALLLLAIATPVAGAHAAFLGSNPAPGVRVEQSPRQVRLTFTEPLNERISKAALVGVESGRGPGRVTSVVTGVHLDLRLPRPLARGAYRVQWHTVSDEDGHALEGSFSFGVQAPAVGGRHDVEQSPWARNGWLRVLARALMYATLLLFSGALLLDVLLGRRGEAWLAPSSLTAAAPGLDREHIARRYRRLTLDLGFAAVAASALSVAADAIVAAGGWSPRSLSDFLLFGSPGLTRLSVVAFAALATALAAARSRAAGVAALGALLAVALSGHANAASPHDFAIVNDWLHLTSTSAWLGGIALIVLVWGPTLRRASRPERLAVAGHLLPRFGRVALPAFAVVVVTGGLSAIIELGRVSALWQTDYGRVLLAKVLLVAAIAAASYIHALRLRPRLLAGTAGAEDSGERRHWQLLRTEPVLGIGVVAAVAVLVAFPLPPRDLGEATGAPAAAACNSCPLPRPAAGELAVADQGGSNIVAGWLRPDGRGLAGTVRLYGLNGPSHDPFDVVGAGQSNCGAGCRRFRLAKAPLRLAVTVRENGRRYSARLPTRYVGEGERPARRLLAQAQATMRDLRSVRETERVSSVPGVYAQTDYRLRAPDRMAYTTNGQVQTVIVAARQWTRTRDSGWHRDQFRGGLPFRTRSWFTWSTYARSVYLLGQHREAGRDVAVVALMDQGTPAWWRLTIDLRTHRVLRDRLVTYGHFMTQRFFAFNRPLRIEPPRGGARGG